MEKEADIQMVMPNDMSDFYDRSPVLSEKIWKRMPNQRLERIKYLLMSADIVTESVLSFGIDISNEVRKSGMFSLFPAKLIDNANAEGFRLAFKVGPIGLPEQVGEDVELTPHMMWFTSDGIVLFSMEDETPDTDYQIKGKLFKDVDEISQRGIFLPSGIPEGRVTSAGLMAKEWLFRFSDSYMLPASGKTAASSYSDLTIIEGGDRFSLGVSAFCADILARGVVEKGLPLADAALFSFYMLCIDMENVSSGSFSYFLNNRDNPGSDLLRHIFRKEDISALESAIRNTFGYARNPSGVSVKEGERRTPKNEIGLRKAEEEPNYISRKEMSLYFDPMPKVLSNTLKGMTRETRPEVKLAESSHPEWDISEKTRAEKYYEYMKPHIAKTQEFLDASPMSVGSALKEFVNNIDDISKNPLVEKLSSLRRGYYEEGSHRFGKAAMKLLETVDPGYVIDEGMFQRKNPPREMSPSEKPYFFRSELQSLAVRSMLRHNNRGGDGILR